MTFGLPLRACAGLGALFLPLLATGCKEGDPEKCTQAQAVVGQSLDAEDFAAARTWREYAYKQCADKGPLAALDQKIAEREASTQQRKAAEEKKRADTNALAKLFFDWVAQNRAAPEHASQTPVCEPLPAGTPAANAKDHFCTTTRIAGANTLEARYFEAEPASAVRFGTVLPGQLDCAALKGTAGKQWDVPAVGGKSAKRTRCELGGALAGLTAVLTAADKAPLYVVSPGYVARDPGWRTILEGP
jgi:hypothetical protein